MPCTVKRESVASERAARAGRSGPDRMPGGLDLEEGLDVVQTVVGVGAGAAHPLDRLGCQAGDRLAQPPVAGAVEDGVYVAMTCQHRGQLCHPAAEEVDHARGNVGGHDQLTEVEA